MKLIDLPAVNDLPIQEKLQLVDELWLSVTQDLKALEVSDEEKKLLDTRWAAFLRDPDSAITVEQFCERLSENRG
jgi:putative addiction module component (TIGR02574 family)